MIEDNLLEIQSYWNHFNRGRRNNLGRVRAAMILDLITITRMGSRDSSSAPIFINQSKSESTYKHT